MRRYGHPARARARLLIASLAATLAIEGCATPYQPEGFTGGYSDQYLGNDEYLITIRGNAYTDHATVWQYFHRRAAEIVATMGCSRYEVLEQVIAELPYYIEGAPMPKPRFAGRIRCVRVAQNASPTVPEVSFGTCFAVSPEGLAITAHHVLKDASVVAVRFAGGSWLSATVTKVSATNDIAILQLGARPNTFLSLASSGSASLGQAVFTVGFPAEEILGADAKFTDGTISALSGPGGEASFFQISAPVQPGSSGGPLVADTGEVIGVVTATAAILPFAAATGALPQNVNWAVKSDFALPLLGGATRQPPTQSRQSAIERAVGAVCAVRATR